MEFLVAIALLERSWAAGMAASRIASVALTSARLGEGEAKLTLPVILLITCFVLPTKSATRRPLSPALMILIGLLV